MKKFSCNRATAFFFDYNILIYKYLCLHDFCTIPFDLSKNVFYVSVSAMQPFF